MKYQDLYDMVWKTDRGELKPATPTCNLSFLYKTLHINLPETLDPPCSKTDPAFTNWIHYSVYYSSIEHLN